MKARAKSEVRTYRKGRNADLQDYDGVLAKLISAREQSGMTERKVSLRLGMAHSFLKAAAMLDVHPRTLQRMVQPGQIAAVQVGKLWRFCASAIDQWIHRKQAS